VPDEEDGLNGFGSEDFFHKLVGLKEYRSIMCIPVHISF
jgi:hypothetical protein